YLVGRRVTPRKGYHALCVAPDDCPFQPEAFAGLDGLAAELRAADPENNVFHSNEVAAENARREIELHALRRAVMRKVLAVTAGAGPPAGISWPARVGISRVMVVPPPPRPLSAPPPRLTRDHVQESAAVTYHRTPSLLSATLDEYLKACATYLHR